MPRRKHSCLDFDTCESLSALLNNGFPFPEAAKILRNRKTAPVFDAVLERLEKGESVDGFLASYMHESIRPLFSAYAGYMPLHNALDLSIRLSREDGEQKKKLLGGVLYPCGLLAGTAGGILLFARYILPVMLSLMASFHMEQGIYASLAGIIRVCAYVFASVLFLCLGAAVYLFHPKRISSTYTYLAKRFPSSLTVQYASRDFTRFYLECMHRGLSTRASLELLSKLDTKPLVACIASQAAALLEQGSAFEEAVYGAGMEPALARFFQIAVYAGDCEGMLEGYLAMFRVRTEKQIRRFSAFVQCLAYTAVGLIIVLVYSVLTMPLTILSEI